MTSDVEICNLALARLGDARITSMTDGSAQATYCSLLYSHTLEELQTDYAWAFCRKLGALSSTTAPAFGYSAAYTLPTDFLRLLRVNGIDKQENFGQWEILGTTLHTSLPAPIQADYLANVTTVTQFPALFVELFSLKLAANLAMPLTGSKELFGQMVEAFAASLQRPAVQELILSNARARATNTITTQADIVRLAILKTGTADGYKPGGQPAILGNSFYEQARNELLSEFDWSFARASSSLAADAANPVTGYARRYALPSGALTILRVNEVDKSENFSVWEVVGGFIHSNATSPIAAEYTTTVTDVTRFPAIFIDLLANKIAMRLAMTNGDAPRMEILAKETEFIFQKPGFTAAIEKIAPIRPNAALSVTEICRQAILRVGTADVFKPFGEPMVIAQSLYEQTRDELLADFQWSFARAQVSVAKDSSNPTTGYDFRYAIPADTKQILRINNLDDSENTGKWEIVGNFIHTDFATPIIVDLITEVTDPTKFPPIFVNLLTTTLAFKLCGLVQLPDKNKSLFEEIQFLMTKPALLEAVEAVANYSGSLTATASEIIRQAVMRVGSADAFKQNGQPFVFAAKFYDQTVKEVLSEFNWQFARSQSTLSSPASSLTNYDNAYTLPANFIRAIQFGGIDASENFGDWEVSGGRIHTNFTGSQALDFIISDADPTRYPAIFIEMVVVRLAYKLAMALGMGDQAAAAAEELETFAARPSLLKETETSAAPRTTSGVVSKSDICKQAVMRLGSTGALGQTGGQPAIFAHSFYDHTLEELLAELPWAFAKKQVSITANATAPTQGYSRRYALPTDFIQLLRVNQIDTTENFGQWEIVGGFLHTDLGSPVILDYTANITDVALFPAPFVEALIARITAKIALPLTGKADIANAMAAVAAESLNRPTIQVLVEKSAKPRAGSPANTVAEICRQAILKVGSADIFKPFGEPMVIAQSLYEQTRNEVLADFDWQFARVQSSLAADAAPPAFGYSARYALPANTLKVLRVNGVDEDENFGNWEIVGGFLHTNFATPIRIETTAIVTDATKFPPVFTNMLTVTLAFKLSQLLEIQVAKA